MADVPKALQLISGGEVTPEQVQRVQAIAHTLDISSNDPLFPLLIALDTYHGVFSDLPTRMSASAKTVVDATTQRAGDRAKINIDDAIAKAIIGMTGALNEASRDVVKKVANDVATKERTKWVVGSLVVACFMFAGFGWYMHKDGYDSGFSVGRGVIYDEKVAAAWGNTDAGKMAKKLSDFGVVELLLKCSGDGWEKKNIDGKQSCFPHSKDGQQTGWKVQ